MVTEWFVVRQVTRDLWMVAEPGHVVSWLYVGSERAILVDSGTGIVPIARLVASLTDRPVTLVNTHYHFDHVGGNAGFAERLAGRRGGPYLERGTPRDLLRRYLAAFPRSLPMHGRGSPRTWTPSRSRPRRRCGIFRRHSIRRHGSPGAFPRRRCWPRARRSTSATGNCG
jgi:glyoxylase-like metal-dependent hydrolase (beta-lactamase superfamily II)